jgi:hypothetical protein
MKMVKFISSGAPQRKIQSNTLPKVHSYLLRNEKHQGNSVPKRGRKEQILPWRRYLKRYLLIQKEEKSLELPEEAKRPNVP